MLHMAINNSPTGIPDDLRFSISISHLERANFVIKTQSEARLENEVLIVHVIAEVVCLQVRFETRKYVVLS